MGYSKKKRYKKNQHGGKVVFKYPEEDFKYAQIYGLIKDDDVRNNVIKIMNEDKHFLFTKDDLLPPQDPGTLELDLYKDFNTKIETSTKKKESFENFINGLKDLLKSAYENEKNIFLRKFVKALHDASNKVLFDQITQEKLFLKKLFPNSGTYIDSIYNVSITSASAVVNNPKIILSANLVSEIIFNIGVIMNAIELENLSILSHLKTIKIFDAIGENKYSFIKSDSIENVTIENNTFSNINQLFFERCPKLKNITIISTALVGDVNSILEKLPDGGESKNVDLTDTNVTIGDQAKYESLLKQKNIKNINIPTATATLSITPSATSVDQTKILKRNRIISGIRIALIEAKYTSALKTIIKQKKSLEAEKKNLESEKANLEAENKKKINKAENDLKASNTKIQALEAEKQTVEVKNTQLENDKARLEADALKKTADLQQAKDEAAAAAQQVADTQAKAEQELEDLKIIHDAALRKSLSEKNQNQNQIKKVQSDLQKLQYELNKLRREGAGQNEIKKKEGDITVFTGLIQNLNAETARKDTEISKIREQQNIAEKQLQDELKTKIREAEQREAEQQRQLENIRAEQQKAEKQRQIELKQIQLSQYELDQANKRLYDDLQRVAIQRNQFAGIMNTMLNEINSKNQQLDKIESENKRLAEQQRQSEIEAQQKRQAEIEAQQKINEQIEQLRKADEVEQKRQEEYRIRQAQLEEERVRQTQIANEISQKYQEEQRNKEDLIKELEKTQTELKTLNNKFKNYKKSNNKQNEKEKNDLAAEKLAAESNAEKIKTELEETKIRLEKLEADAEAAAETERIKQTEIAADKQRQAELEAERVRQEEIEAENRRLAELEAERIRQAELEAERIRQAELEAERIKQEEIEAENRRLAELEAERIKQAEIEAENRRLAELEAERIKQAEIEAEQQRQADIEAERIRQAEIESERIKQAEIEAEQKRQAEIEAEQKRQAELEAEQKRQAELEAEQKRLDDIEAEKQRQSKIEAEKQRQEEIEAEQKRQEEIEAEQKRQEEIEAEQKRQEEIEAERIKQEEIEAENKRLAEIEAEQKRQAEEIRPIEQLKQNIHAGKLWICNVQKTTFGTTTHSCESTKGKKNQNGFDSTIKKIGESAILQIGDNNFKNILYVGVDDGANINKSQHFHIVWKNDSQTQTQTFLKANKEEREIWIAKIQEAFNLKPLYHCNNTTRLTTPTCVTTTLGRIKNNQLEIYYYDLHNYEKPPTHTYKNITKVETSSDVGGENMFVITYKKENTDKRYSIDSKQNLQTNNKENRDWWIEQINKMIPATPKRGGRGTKRMRSDHKHNDTKQNRGKKFRVTRKKLRKAKSL